MPPFSIAFYPFQSVPVQNASCAAVCNAALAFILDSLRFYFDKKFVISLDFRASICYVEKQ